MKHWKIWAADPKVARWFPFSCDSEEIERTARHVFSFVPLNGVLTAECDGQPCGLAGLILPEFRKLSHQAPFSIIVAEPYRNQGVGSLLIRSLMARAKNSFGIRLLLLEVYEGNPARSLYLRMGFVDFGFQPCFSNVDGELLGRHLMCKAL
ncbi:MAG: GNAT family N-acetyltransferase [Syntrophobacteraceae bacterium]|nr:GNAT family N-acetyltransferase [Syntrophobacteraceae bacterium]